MRMKVIIRLALLTIVITTVVVFVSCNNVEELPRQTEGETTETGATTEVEMGRDTDAPDKTDDFGVHTDTEATTEANFHAFGLWTVATTATCTEDGTEVRTCVCGEQETRALTSLGHNYVNRVCEKCGDKQYSEGLAFASNGNGTCYVAGIGSCKDTDIWIPPASPNGDIVTSIGEEAFYKCTSLTSVTIPDSVTSIDWRAFLCCTSLASITIPDSVTSIGWGAFERCTSLTSVTIGSNVISIGGAAFSSCSGLTSITIPDSVTSIGSGAFSDCTNLFDITIPDSVTSIGGWAFYGTDYYNDSSNWEDHMLYIGKHLIKANDTYDLYITPGNIKPGTLTIADDAFEQCFGLCNFAIPDSVTSIGNGAFGLCLNLNSITIPDSVTSIGAYAFSGCSNLTSITLPDSVTSIGGRAFSGCSGLTSITIPDSVTSIGVCAFSGCSGLTSIQVDKDNKVYHSNRNCLIETATKTLMACCKNSVIPPDGSVTRIDGAFSGYSDLTSITIPDNVTIIGDWAFYGCSSLTSITIPDSVTSIGESAFEGCTSLTSITISDSVTSIGDSAFCDCNNLTSVIIPDSVTAIGNYAFSTFYYEYTSLTSITFNGTKDQWEGIDKGKDWHSNSITVHCTDGNIKEK